MLNNISWQEYLTAVGGATVLYYIFVAIRYYRDNLTKIMNRRTGNSREMFVYDNADNPDPATSESEAHEPIEVGSEIDLIEDLAERLANSLKGKGNSSKQELEEYIGLLFKDYPILKTSTLRESISELVVSECEKNGISSLSKSEVDKLW